jgi:hypothetical protein
VNQQHQQRQMQQRSQKAQRQPPRRSRQRSASPRFQQVWCYGCMMVCIRLCTFSSRSGEVRVSFAFNTRWPPPAAAGLTHAVFLTLPVVTSLCTQALTTMPACARPPVRPPAPASCPGMWPACARCSRRWDPPWHLHLLAADAQGQTRHGCQYDSLPASLEWTLRSMCMIPTLHGIYTVPC